MTWHPIAADHPPPLNSLVQDLDGECGKFKNLLHVDDVPHAVLASIPTERDGTPIAYAVPLAECSAWYGAFADLATAASLQEYMEGRYLTAHRPEWWAFEREVNAARSPWELARVAARWPEALRAEVRAQWAIDGRLAALEQRLEVWDLKYGEVAA